MTRAKPAPETPLPLPTAGGSYIREADGSLTLVPDGPDPAPPSAAPAALTEAPAEKET